MRVLPSGEGRRVVLPGRVVRTAGGARAPGWGPSLPGPHSVATLPTMPSDDRVNIILPQADRDLADRIAEALGASERGRSQAIRFGLKCAAEKLGLGPDGKKIRKRQTRA